MNQRNQSYLEHHFHHKYKIHQNSPWQGDFDGIFYFLTCSKAMDYRLRRRSSSVCLRWTHRRRCLREVSTSVIRSRDARDREPRIWSKQHPAAVCICRRQIWFVCHSDGQYHFPPPGPCGPDARCSRRLVRRCHWGQVAERRDGCRSGCVDRNCRHRAWIYWRPRWVMKFSIHTEMLAEMQAFLRFEKRFWEAPFSRQISVDGRLSHRNKTAGLSRLVMTYFMCHN